MKLSTPSVRLLILAGIILAGMAALGVKLYLEQIRRTQAHNMRISRQSLRMIRRPALRGRIHTSDFRVLAGNIPVYNVHLYLAEMRRPGSMRRTLDHIEAVIARLAEAIGRENTVTRDDIIRHINIKPGLPFVPFTNLNEQEIARANAVAMIFEGIVVMPETARIYPFGPMAAHLIGFTRLRDPAQASDRRDYFYYLPDLAGVSGLERAYDRLPGEIGLQNVRGLCGIPGYDSVRVDHRGFVDQVLPGGEVPLNGNSLVTTLNFDAQRIAEEILRGNKGAFVLLDADTGEVLALASSPTFNLSDFSPVRNNPKIRELNSDPERPQVNRALLGTYMPGSIIKPLIGLAVLNDGISPAETIECTGRTQIGDASIRCTGHHGQVDLEFGLERSCNVYFNVRGMELGLDKIRSIMEAAGFGAPSGIGLVEASGTLPGPGPGHPRWTAFDDALVAIGQGVIEITPLQAAVYVAALANGGKVMRPTLLREIRDPQGILLYSAAPQLRRRLPVTQPQLEIVKEGMRRVVNTPRGSGRQAQMARLTLYGKTGSAEVGPRHNRHKNTFFTCFCYHEGRTYAALLLIVDGDSGGATCAPLMRRFFSEWLNLN